jgi:hypothetical protein
MVEDMAPSLRRLYINGRAKGRLRLQESTGAQGPGRRPFAKMKSALGDPVSSLGAAFGCNFPGPVLTPSSGPFPSAHRIAHQEFFSGPTIRPELDPA